MSVTERAIDRLGRRATGLLLILLAAIGFGTIAIFGTLATDAGLNNPTLLTVRFALATTLLVGLLSYRGEAARPPREALPAMVGLGLAYAAMTAAFFWGLLFVPAGLATITLYTYPVYVFLIGTVLLDETLTRRKLVALAVAVSGVVLIVGIDTGGVDAFGLLLVTVSAMAYAVYTTGSRAAVETIGADRLATAAMATTGACFLAYGVASGTLFVPTTVRQWGIIVGIALVGTVVPIRCFVNGLRFIEADRASIVSTVEPVVTVLLGIVVLGERLSPAILLGGGMVLVGVVLIRTADGGTKVPPSE